MHLARALTSGHALALLLAGLAYAVAYPNALASAEAIPPGYTVAEDGSPVPLHYYDEDAAFAWMLCADWPDKAPEACAALARDTNARTVADVLGALD